MLTEAVLREVQRDVSAFADPGSLVEMGSGNVLRWTRGRVGYSAKLLLGPSAYPDLEIEGQRLTYQGFLSSPYMADLRDLAVSIQTQIPPIDSFTSAPAREMSHTENPVTHGDSGTLLLARAAGALPYGSTRVLFVHANAGAGKTSLLRQVTRLQAERYLEGGTTALLLYLDAQGKGLSQLEDVMARALQDLRARFTYHCLAPLTRRGCIVPVVDGFDELIGPSSAREAFGNLAQFLAQLDCTGAVITSSRSAFIDYATLHARATEIAAAQGLSYEIYPVELLAWPDETVFALASTRLGGDQAAEAAVRRLLATAAGDLIRKPFFLSHVCNILSDGGTVRGDEDLVAQVVEAALGRESSKLRDRQQKPLLSSEQHRRFCQALAEEMWWQDRAELDTQTIRTVAELFAEEAALGAQDAKLLVDRSIAHGLLAVAQGDHDKRVFEHELFRFDFQAGRLAVALVGSEGDLRDFVLRRELPLELVARVAVYQRLSPSDLVRVLGQLGVVARSAKASPHAAVNAGTLSVALLDGRTDVPASGSLDGLMVRVSADRGVKLDGWTVRDCVFESVDLSLTELLSCRVEGTYFVGCRVGSGTRLDGTQVSIEAFPGVKLADGTETYDPVAILSFLRQAGALLDEQEIDSGAALPSPAVEARIELVERLLKHARNHFYLSPAEDWVRNRLLDWRAWAAVEECLRKHGLLTDVKLVKSGPPEVFWRLTAPPDVIWRGRTGKSDSVAVAAFWRDLMVD